MGEVNFDDPGVDVNNVGLDLSDASLAAYGADANLASSSSMIPVLRRGTKTLARIVGSVLSIPGGLALLPGVATVLGVDPGKLLAAWVGGKGRRRRRRGISGRDLTNARRTIRTISSFQAQLQQAMPHHRAAPRQQYAFHRRRKRK